MAEYYPLLAKAVAGLPNATPEIRRAVYERARKALLTQLLNLDPPLAEADIARETDALDGAVARLEAELTPLNGRAAETPPAAAPVAPEPSAPGRAASPIAPPRRPAGPISVQGAPSPAAPGRASPGPAPSRSVASPPSPSGAKLTARQTPPEFAEQEADAEPSIPPTRPERSVQRPRAGATPGAAGAAPTGLDAESGDAFEDAPFADVQKPRAESMRLYAPQQPSDEGRGSFRLWIVGGIVAVVVAVVAVAAWTLRDRPDHLAKLKQPTETQSEKTGKIVERIGGGTQQEGEKLQQEPSPGEQAAVQTPVAPANPAPKPSDSGQTIPVAQRAALLVEAPNEPNKVKTYVGTVVWRLDNVSSGPGQPLGTAVHADVDIPDDKLKASLTLQKNMDASLPASHTMTIVFTVQPGSPTGGVKQISVPQLRPDDSPTGEALLGVPVPIMDNSFLVGLSRGSAEATNLELIKQRAWFDIPILLDNGHIAKLTFEKSTSGTRAIDDAIAAWKTQ